MKHHPRSGKGSPLDVMDGRPLAHVPHALPPMDPALIPDYEMLKLLEEAGLALGKLDSLSSLLPDRGLFHYMFVRLEAVLSSQIEGTQSTLNDLLSYEDQQKPGVPLDDVMQVSNYVKAVEAGFEAIKQNERLDTELLLKLHSLLLKEVRGDDKDPGQLRSRQNWIGGDRPDRARYVPPPAAQVPRLLDELFYFLENDDSMPTLLQAGLAHAQFESIHPFLDGNGRTGRLLIVLVLLKKKLLHEPLLYPSLYFKKRQQEYYNHLQAVREEGDWESWLKFYLEGVAQAARQAVFTAQQIISLLQKDEAEVKKAPASTLKVFDYFKQYVLGDIKKVVKFTNLSYPTVSAAVAQLVELGILVEHTGRKRDRGFFYAQYYTLLTAEMEEGQDEAH